MKQRMYPDERGHDQSRDHEGALLGAAARMTGRSRFALPSGRGSVFLALYALGFCVCLLQFVERAAAQQRPAIVPVAVPVDASVRSAIDAAWLTDDERRDLRIFHGIWSDEDLDQADATGRAMIALNAWRLDDPVLDDPNVPIEFRAEARLRSGDLQEAIDLLDGADSIRASRIRAESHEQWGRFDEADRVVERPVNLLLRDRLDEADELTEGVRALFVRSRVQGQPARDYNTMMRLIARAHQDLDRLHWPARIAEAELLFDKDRTRLAVETLHEALGQNPRSSEAWFMLGRIALGMMGFGEAELAAEHLRKLNPEHALADLLIAETRLVQDDPEGALEILEPVLARWPMQRAALALNAAAHAILYDEDAKRAALARYDEISPGSPRAYHVAGRHLSLNRQYEAAAEMLEEAIRRQPNWPAPQIELGLMELQSGRDHRAHDVLRRVRELDPFNYRATNSLALLDEITQYKRIETDNFIIRYKPGIDRVVAELMPERLEEIHRTVTERFQFEPDRKTIIELMPDHNRFAVRIVGMPHVHTIAACTGPVIAMEVPREGPAGRHSGPFDWPRVVQHEYTHTVTLAQTRNRIPHWLTEAAAVEMERAPRDYNTLLLLARSHELGELFSLDEIKWAFVRPRRPQDRGLAYAQGYWMLRYMNETFGDDAVIRLLSRYFDGEREERAIPSALGVSRGEFFDGFLEWAKDDIRSWGLAAKPTISELIDQLDWRDDPELAVAMAASQKARLDAIVRRLTEEVGRPSGDGRAELEGEDWPELRRPRLDVTPAMIERWIEKYPDHPDLAELRIRRHEGSQEELIALLERYASLRPVDPMPHERLAQIHLASEDRTKAIPHLEFLDAREENSPVFAAQLARLYREKGDLDRALAKARRAVDINPYHAPHRELAAAIAIEMRGFDAAHQHLSALTLLEPEREQHQRRLEALERLRAAR